VSKNETGQVMNFIAHPFTEVVVVELAGAV